VSRPYRNTRGKHLHQSRPSSKTTRTRPHTVSAETSRIFITDAVLNGLPPHIARVIAGHRDINVTMGYVYPDEAIQSHLAFLCAPPRATSDRRIPCAHR
jgi:hypothetical protein